MSCTQKAGVSRTLEVLIVEERLNDRKILKVHPTHDAMFHHVNYHKCSSLFTSHFTIYRFADCPSSKLHRQDKSLVHFGLPSIRSLLPPSHAPQLPIELLLFSAPSRKKFHRFSHRISRRNAHDMSHIIARRQSH